MSAKVIGAWSLLNSPSFAGEAGSAFHILSMSGRGSERDLPKGVSIGFIGSANAKPPQAKLSAMRPFRTLDKIIPPPNLLL